MEGTDPMNKRYAREIRAGIKLARRHYPFDALPEDAPVTFPLFTRAYQHEWARQEAKRPVHKLDFSRIKAFKASLPARKTGK